MLTQTNREQAIKDVATLLNTEVLAGCETAEDYVEVFYDHRFEMLSSGERVIVGVIVDMAVGKGCVSLVDILNTLSDYSCAVVLAALKTYRGL